MLSEEGWADTAAIATTRGGVDKHSTCHSSHKAKQTRRDYIFVNKQLLPAIGCVRVQYCDDHPTHQLVQIKIATEKLERTCRRLRNIDSAAEAEAKRIAEATEGLDSKQAHKAKGELKERLHEMMDGQLATREKDSIGHNQSRIQPLCGN